MAYKSLQTLTDSLRAVISSHAQVECVHFSSAPGSTDDLDNPKDATDVTYPYVYVIPDQVTNDSKISLSLQMIIMRQCIDKELDILQCQSDMLDIGRDIVAYYTQRAATEEINITLPFTAIPFVDRMKDIVAGVTLSFTITVPAPLSNCNFPLRS